MSIRQQALTLIRFYLANHCPVPELRSIADNDLFFLFLDSRLDFIIDNCFYIEAGAISQFNWMDIEYEVYYTYRQFQQALALDDFEFQTI